MSNKHKSDQRCETINLRASRRQKALIDQAASALGRNRSDFMLEIICREAESVLLDQRYFSLTEETFLKFMDLLDEPPKDNLALKKLLQTKAPWEHK
ncbi:MAG: type II toxin-antitoxin system TacA family antitoxin [Parachlamydiaceae bacterium]